MYRHNPIKNVADIFKIVSAKKACKMPPAAMWHLELTICHYAEMVLNTTVIVLSERNISPAFTINIKPSVYEFVSKH